MIRRVCAVRTHAVFLKNVLPNQTKGRLKVFPNFQTAFLYSYFCLFFQPCNQFIGQVQISLGAFGVGVVGEGGEAVAGGFGEADVAGDDGVEEQVAEVLFELFADFDDEAAAAVVHGADDAGYVEVGVDGLADFADGGH